MVRLNTLLCLSGLATAAATNSTLTSTGSLEHEGKQRTWVLEASPTAAAAGTRPLVIDMHGFGNPGSDRSSPDNQIDRTGFLDLVETEGIFVAYPEGNAFSDNSWNAGSCCGQAARAGEDDVGFILKMVTQLAEENPAIDLSRVYASGHSNGCALAQKLGAQASDKIAAVGCFSFYLLDAPSADYTPVPFIEVHGINDPTVRYGRPSSGAEGNFQTLGELNGCAASSLVEEDFDGDYSTRTFTKCDAGVEVELVTVAERPRNLAHSPYTTKAGADMTELVWQFMRRFPLE